MVLHHGRGTEERDLLGLADALDPERRLHVVTPRAPLRVAASPGYHWYLVPRVGYPDRDTFHAARAALADLHDSLWERTGLEPGRTVLGGFSQGAVMSYAMSLGPGRPRPAGLVAMSGFLPRVEGWPLDPGRLAGVPVAVAHGSLDPVIGVGYGREAADTLEAAGVDVVRLETAVPHMVDPGWIEPLRALVAEAVPSSF